MHQLSFFRCNFHQSLFCHITNSSISFCDWRLSSTFSTAPIMFVWSANLPFILPTVCNWQQAAGFHLQRALWKILCCLPNTRSKLFHERTKDMRTFGTKCPSKIQNDHLQTGHWWMSVIWCMIKGTSKCIANWAYTGSATLDNFPNCQGGVSAISGSDA